MSLKDLWRLGVLGILALACSLPVAASNRCDINGDQAVNATDQVLLANVLAGNADLGNYNLENVVVVAKRGGDFTDPCAAATWVASQNPTVDKPWVILVTPGKYVITTDLDLPSYTTLRGYGPNATLIVRQNPADNLAYSAVVGIHSKTCVTVENIALESLENDSQNSVLWAQSSTKLIFRNLALMNHATGGMGNSGLILQSSGSALVNHVGVDSAPSNGSSYAVSVYGTPQAAIVFEHCRAAATGLGDVAGFAFATESAMDVEMRDCVSAVTKTGTAPDQAIRIGNYARGALRIYNSSFTGGWVFKVGTSVTLSTRFYGCELNGTFDAAGTDAKRCMCYQSDGTHLAEP